MPSLIPSSHHGGRARLLSVLVTVAAAVAACGGSDPEPTPPVRAAAGEAVLKSYTGEQACERNAADLRGRIEASLGESLEWERYYRQRASWSAGGASPAAGAPPSASAPEAASPAAAWSTTTVRTEGVDEADRVKTDGRHLFHLKTGIDDIVLTRIALAGGGAMTADGRWSSEPLGDAGRIESAEGLYLLDAPEPGDTTSPGTGRIAVLSRIGQAPGIAWPTTGAAPFLIASDLCTYPGCGPMIPPEVRLRILDIRATPFAVERDVRLDGQLLGSRRIGDRLHVITQSSLSMPAGLTTSLWETTAGSGAGFEAAYRHALEQNARRLAATPLQSLLAPRADGAEGPLPSNPTDDDCATLFGTDAPVLPATVQIATVDLATGTVSRQTVLGRATSFMMTERALILATSSTNWHDSTDLHRFVVDSDGRLAYQGSGRVGGRPIDDHAIDESAAGTVRVATTQWDDWSSASFPSWASPTVTRVTTLQPTAAPRSWPQLGQTPPIAPGETMTAARFIGDRAYLVTVVQFIDPFVVVDLSDDTRPTTLGELKLPGFSTYLHPVGPNHLLGIGMGPSATGGNSIKAALFDVTDPGAPREQAALELGPADVSSEALWDRHAFSWYSPPTTPATIAAGLPTGGAAGTMAMPVIGRANAWVGGTDQSGLRVVSVRPEAGAAALTLNGTIWMTDLLDGPFNREGWRSGDVRRGLFVDTTVFAIADGAVRSAPIAEPETTIGTLRLP